MEKEFKGYIYMLEFPSGKSYIGQTINLTRRKSEHKNMHGGMAHQPKLYRAILKYKWENVNLVILEEIVDKNLESFKEKLNKLEVDYIKQYDTIKNGYNICEGGGSHRYGVKSSKESIEKIKAYWTDEKRAEMSIKMSGKNNPCYGMKRGKSPHRKKVNKYSLDGVFIETFDSITEAANSIGGKRYLSNISASCLNKTNHVYGYIWRFADKINNKEDFIFRKKKERKKRVWK